jgi:hypothetical protein
MKPVFCKVSVLILLSILGWGCGSLPRGAFHETDSGTPDYSIDKNWAALPTRSDSADIVPMATWSDAQSTAAVDVFFLHPTTYTGKSQQCQWNASIDDAEMNARTDRTTIRYQASLFNGAGRVYAPRYRQAHLDCFYTDDDKDAAVRALDLAYRDLRAAFQYYLDNYNQGRPFIIAAHSQGSFHAARLIRDEIETSPLRDQFIVAYLPGIPVSATYFKRIKPCTTPTETGCFCSWRTFQEGYKPPEFHFPDDDIVVTNPVTWLADDTESEKSEQQGAVLRNLYEVVPGLVSTSVYEDLLWVSKPRFPGSFLMMTKNYHIADYNFFYADVRKNAQDRVAAYLARH